MKLKLTKPIAFFDLETTGINITTDRIVEISIVKVMPNGEETTLTHRINPTIPIPKESSEIHGIVHDDIKDKPTFAELAKEISNFITDCDLAGFNSNRFDIPLLAEEFLRVDVDFDMRNRRFVDVQTIFHKKEQRTLEAAYKFYCGKKLEGAHGAEADTLATYEVLKAQLDKYDDLENDMNYLNDFSSHNKNADFAGRIVFNKEDVEVFNFGKHKGVPVADVFQKEPGYYSWMMNNDFPLYTKKILTAIKLKSFNTK